MKRAMTNWKTTLAGLVIASGTVLQLTGVVTERQTNAILGVAAAFGLTQAKDNNVSGGTKVDPKDQTGVTVPPK